MIPLFRRFCSSFASVNQSEDPFSFGARCGDATAIFAFRLCLGDAPHFKDLCFPALEPNRKSDPLDRPFSSKFIDELFALYVYYKQLSISVME